MRIGILITAFGLALAGCEKVDTRREAVEIAQKRAKVGAYTEAIASYESALDGTTKTADIHYKIAILYDDKLKQPLAAVHHYNRYLALSPDGPRAKEAKAARSDCERRLEIKPGREGLMTQSDAVKLRARNERLESDNKLLLQSIEKLGGKSPLIPPKSDKPAQPPGTQEYTVVPGDTLASIAHKFYKNRALASHLKDANSVQLGGKDIIRPGQVLIIPDRPTR